MRPFCAGVLWAFSNSYAACAAPVHGSDWDERFNCPAIVYPRRKHACGDTQCSGPGKVCLNCGWGRNRTNLASCCQKSDLPQPQKLNGRYPCRRQGITDNEKQYCQWRCCSDPQSVPCGEGCCKPGTHGSLNKCGRTLNLTGGKPKQCCVASNADPLEQLQQGCCQHSVGVKCTQPSLHSRCCLWTEYYNVSTRQRIDPHSPCQPKDCASYEPCQYGEGFACNANAHHKFAERVCCSKPPAVYVSEFDLCQRKASDCETRWQPCIHGVGLDCSRDHRACCLPGHHIAGDGPCQRDCSNYKPPTGLGVWIGIGIAFLVVLAGFGWCFKRCRKRRQEASADADVMPPPALVIANSDYHGRFKPLPQAKRDGQEVVKLLHEAGYDVIVCYNADRNDMISLRKQLLQRLGSIENAVVPIYFAGHGLEAAGTTFLVPVDAGKNPDAPLNPDEHVSLSSFLQLPRRAHVPTEANAISCDPISSPLFLCLLDSCRELVPGEDGAQFAVAASRAARQPPRRRQSSAAEVAILYACEEGDFAQEADGHGYFTKALLEHGKEAELTLQSMLSNVSEQVKRETTDAQQKRPSVRIQKPCLVCPLCGQLEERKFVRGPRRRCSSGGYSDDTDLSTCLPQTSDDSNSTSAASARSPFLVDSGGV